MKLSADDLRSLFIQKVEVEGRFRFQVFMDRGLPAVFVTLISGGSASCELTFGGEAIYFSTDSGFCGVEWADEGEDQDDVMELLLKAVASYLDGHWRIATRRGIFGRRGAELLLDGVSLDVSLTKATG